MRCSSARVITSVGASVGALLALLAGCGNEPAHQHTPPVQPPAQTFEPIDGTFVVDSVNPQRPVTFHVPADYDPATAYPLVILLAGYGVTGAQFDSALGFGAFANTNEFIYAAPEGRVDSSGQSFWNASNACCDFAQTGVDDSAFLADVVKAAEAIAHVSVAYVIGHSNGGFMAQRLACDHADLFRGVVSVSGAQPDACQPSQPIAVLEAHGTGDQTILYDGGSVDPRVPAYPSALTTASSWATLNHCDADPVDDPTALDLDTSLAGAETHVKRWQGCDTGGAAELWTSDGGQHVPRGPPDYLSHLLGFLTAH